MKKILNIDGGGVRVYFPLLILNYIEKKTGEKIIDLFDFFSGVSASAIILSGLLTIYSLEEIIKKFKELSSQIFYKSYFYTIKSMFGVLDSKYPDYYINYEFQKLYKELKISDIKKPFIILTYDLSSSKPKCFHSYHKIDDNNLDYLLWELIRSSTAAPTYFPAYQLNNLTLIDGGIVANNLSELSFTHALSHFGNDENFLQLSIGTGNYLPKFNNPPSGLLSWSGPIFDVLFSAASTNDMNKLMKIGRYENLKHFFRLDINLNENILLDDYNAFDKMDIIFNKWLNENKDEIDKICDEIIKNTRIISESGEIIDTTKDLDMEI